MILPKVYEVTVNEMTSCKSFWRNRAAALLLVDHGHVNSNTFQASRREGLASYTSSSFAINILKAFYHLGDNYLLFFTIFIAIHFVLKKEHLRAGTTLF